jgi:hypothetical protein
MITDGDSDFWTDRSGDAVVERNPNGDTAFNTRIIEDVEPLVEQFGLAKPLTVPPQLHEILFGQADVIEGRSVLPLHTYAVLDAA